ncbi:MAG: hypothetical protein ACJAT4_000342 [Granulosicoccus sp.]|jgi:hypothetical protein
MNELEYFYHLKKELLRRYQETYPQWKRPIHDFKGKEIANFQELLEEKVNSRISEKWFYTHLKPTRNEKLPRMDMLDLLSQFLDFSDWEKFKIEHQIEVEVSNIIETRNDEVYTLPSKKKIVIFMVAFFVIYGLISSFFSEGYDACQFCFEDGDTHQLIENQSIEIQIFQAGESPIIQKTNAQGCFKWPTKNDKISFAVNAPYYRSDTISRVIKNKNHEEVISLKKDDYALMIHFFSNSDFVGWEKRRAQLDQMMADDAIIFQVEKGNTMSGLDMLNKEEFIDRLTLPINSLKNIRIIHSIYQDKKIFRLRFILEEYSQGDSKSPYE